MRESSKASAKDHPSWAVRDSWGCNLGAIIPFLCCLALLVVIFSSSLSLHAVAKSRLFFDSYFAQMLTFTPPHPLQSSLTSKPLSTLALTAPSHNHSTNSTYNASSITPGGDVFMRGDKTAGDDVWHSMSDEELMRQASMVPREVRGRAAKVAFMFLTRGRMPLRPLWERFFRGHHGLFSIYVHASPDFKEEPPEGSVFFRRRIPSKPVEWGRASMVDGERRLLANALLDFSNERFVLLSESCIPLFNFTTVYSYLTHAHLSFIGSFDEPSPRGRGRYSKRMQPAVALQEWRKGSQWFEARRELAVEIISDRRYYPVFLRHCRPPCYMDEHYLPTLVTKLFPGRNSNRSLTWVDWSGGGPHPAAYRRGDVTLELVQRMRHGSECVYNGNVSRVCHLFARKFEGSALEPLMRMASTQLGK